MHANFYMVYAFQQKFLSFYHNLCVLQTDRRTDRNLVANTVLHSMQ